MSKALLLDLSLPFSNLRWAGIITFVRKYDRALRGSIKRGEAESFYKWPIPEAYSELCQRSKMERFANTVNGL